MPDKKMSVFLPADVWAKINKIAQEEDRSAASVVRRLVAKALEKDTIKQQK